MQILIKKMQKPLKLCAVPPMRLGEERAIRIQRELQSAGKIRPSIGQDLRVPIVRLRETLFHHGAVCLFALSPKVFRFNPASTSDLAIQ